MAKIVFLGTATNIPDATHENTHLALADSQRLVLIDGPGNPYARLLQAGLDLNQLTDIVLTHFHPDHVAGIPTLLMALGLSGRKRALSIHANEHCLQRLVRMLEDYQWERWHWFQVAFASLPETEGHLCLETEAFRLFCSPVKHFIPAIGVRIEFAGGGRTVVYSGDSAPTPALDRLADGAEILIHEAAGASAGHSSAVQAGETAARAGARALYLVHYPVGEFDSQSLIAEASRVFNGEVHLARDFDVIEL